MASEGKREVGKSLALIEHDFPLNEAKPKTKKVLDENKYAESIEKIIVRDFFPDLPALKEKQEYLEALQKNDTEKLRALHMKYSKRTPGTGRPGTVLSTPSVFETPIDKPPQVPKQTEKEHTESKNTENEFEDFDFPSFENDSNKNSSCDKRTKRPTHNPEPAPVKTKIDDSELTLDKFLSKNTSEDNESFVDIMEESAKKHRVKHAWLFEAEREQEEQQSARLALPGIEQQAIAANTGSVDTWTYTPKNALMYNPEGLEMTAEEKMKLIAKGGRAIEHKNTRFHALPMHATQNSIKQAASTSNKLLMGRVGVDGKEMLPKTTPRVNGYGFVATPTPAPGEDSTPFMTWGEIEGTPFGLDPSTTPLYGATRTPGPQFKIPDVPQRDRIGLELAERASKLHRDKKNDAIRRVQRNMASPSPRFGASKTDRLTGLSPAAQKLASGRLGIGAGSDRALSSSYTPSPRSARRDRTPLSLTPSPHPGTGKRTPKAGFKRPPTGGSLTDNLLVLPKRNK